MTPCPACFCKEVDPVPLHRDRETGELYCTKCNYVAKDAAVTQQFLEDFIRHRHGIDTVCPANKAD
jgi:transcription initiation factor TFIIIB Brf1 subunit/transcription initiation factor TFIIB